MVCAHGACLNVLINIGSGGGVDSFSLCCCNETLARAQLIPFLSIARCPCVARQMCLRAIRPQLANDSATDLVFAVNGERANGKEMKKNRDCIICAE